jgi:peptidyl-prolyl cis-trans isomerase A (cyclophilin A)
MMRPTAIALALLAPALASAQGEPASAAKPGQDEYAVFVTSRGKIGVRLLPAGAPNAVRNLVDLARGKKSWTDPQTGQKVQKPLYDGTVFHRVIPGFMIQGGDPLTRGAKLGAIPASAGTGGPGYKFADELDPRARPFDAPCQLAMANSGPNTNGSQFFITEVSTPHLNPRPCGAPSGTCGYVRLGEGVCGCELVRTIAAAGNGQTRLEKVVITGEKPTCK